MAIGVLTTRFVNAIRDFAHRAFNLWLGLIETPVEKKSLKRCRKKLRKLRSQRLNRLQWLQLQLLRLRWRLLQRSLRRKRNLLPKRKSRRNLQLRRWSDICIKEAAFRASLAFKVLPESMERWMETFSAMAH